MIDVFIKIYNKTWRAGEGTQLLIIMLPKKGKPTPLPETLNHQPHQIHAESSHECISRNSKLKRFSTKNRLEDLQMHNHTLEEVPLTSVKSVSCLHRFQESF